MEYIDAKALHLKRFGRIIPGVHPFDRGALRNLVDGESWCGPWRGIGCEAERIAIEFEANQKNKKKNQAPQA